MGSVDHTEIGGQAEAARPFTLATYQPSSLFCVSVSTHPCVHKHMDTLCVHMGTRAFMHACACVHVPEAIECCVLPILFPETGSFTKPEAHHFGSTGCSPFFPPPFVAAGVRDTHGTSPHSASPLSTNLGAQDSSSGTQVLLCGQQVLFYPSHLLNAESRVKSNCGACAS